MEEIRSLRAEEIDECLSLSSFAFQFDLTEDDRIVKRAELIPEQHWGYFVDGKLAAKIRIIPMRMYIQGRSYEMGGIAGVATWPEYRRKGMIGKLLTRSLHVMRQHGQTVSALHPFSFAFYRKYGWEMNTEYKQYTIDRSFLNSRKETIGTLRRYANFIDHWSLFDGIYHQFASRYNGMIHRDEQWWRQIVSKQKRGTAVVYFSPDGEAQGYILYEVKQKELTVKEMVFCNEAARQALWKLVCDHDSMVERVTMRVPPNDRLPFLLPEPRIKQEIIPYSMARVVDVEPFITQYPFQPIGQTVQFGLCIHDPAAPWNDGSFKVTVDPEGHATVQKSAQSDPGDQGGRNLLSCDIQTFSTMMTGYQKASDLHAAGRLNGHPENVERWEQLIPDRPVFLNDFF